MQIYQVGTGVRKDKFFNDISLNLAHRKCAKKAQETAIKIHNEK